MKKVRLMVGALGALGVTPALGVIAPTANAATAHTPRENTKTVSLNHRSPAPNVNPLCVISHRSGHDGNFGATISYSAGGCIGRQVGVLFKEQTGLTARIRDYVDKTRTYQAYIGGVIASGRTTFSDRNSVPGYQACLALVANSNHNDVKYGPVCIAF